jgi:copper chaperone CopZ
MASETIELKIDGMTCSHCQRAVHQALQKLPGVEHVRVDLEHGRAIISGSALSSAMISAVEEEGYLAQVIPNASSHGT